jgi:hypothetical protein
MAKKSSKAQKGALTSLDLKFDGGLNLSEAPSNIADNELTIAVNYLYDAATGTPIIRPALRCQTTSNPDTTWPIQKLYHYRKSSTESWLVAACHGNLYYLSGTGLDGWTKIGALNDVTTIPSFITFHAKLLIADGGTHIKTWDGTTYGALSDGLAATCITSIKGRVVVNSTGSGSNDLVTFSGPEDETKWNTSTEGAIGLRAGFGDNMSVNAFAVFGDDLIISKKGESFKKMYRVNVADATATNWYVESLNTNNCSESAHTMVSAFNNVFFADTNGFKSLKGVTEYGDLQIDHIGAKMNPFFSAGNACVEMVYLPYFSAIWFIISEKVYTYCPLFDRSGNIRHVFTDLIFEQGQINSIVQAGADDIYLANNTGGLFKLDLADLYSQDETSTGVVSNYEATIQTKRFNFFGGGIVRRVELYLNPLNTGTALLYAITPSTEGTLLKTITLRSSGEYLYDATEYLYDATDNLYDMGKTAWYELCRNKIRGGSIQFKLTSTSGRVGVEGLKAEIALVEGD